MLAGLGWAGAVWGTSGVAGQGSAPRSPATVADTPQQTLVARAVPPEDGSPRGFSHRLHRGVDCTACHLSRQSHGALKIRTAEDCQACHHSPTQKAGCASCHDAGKLPPPSVQTVDVRTSVASSASRRSLPFSHGLHGQVQCAECHGRPPSAGAGRACSSCHDQHHTEKRACQQCHRPQDVKGHAAEVVHTGCAGGGCHADAAVTRLRWSRNVCLGCHQDRTEHRKPRDCAACHRVPALQASRQEVAR